MAGAPERDEVLAMLATYGDRQPTQVPEGIDSLELAWLIHQIEQRYDTVMDVDDDTLARMTTVSGVVDVLRDLRVAQSVPGSEGRGRA